MSTSSCETGSQTDSARLQEHMADSLRRTFRTPTKSMMQLLAKFGFICQRGYMTGSESRHEVELEGIRERSSLLLGNLLSDAEAIVGTRLRFEAQEELWTYGVQVSVNR